MFLDQICAMKKMHENSECLIYPRIKISDFFDEISPIYQILVVSDTILDIDCQSVGISIKCR